MEQRRLRLGDILDDYCPRERRLTNHAVVAMIEEDVKQTRCTTCEAEHVYKGGKVPTRKKKDAPGALYKEVLAGMPDDTPPLLAITPLVAPLVEPAEDAVLLAPPAASAPVLAQPAGHHDVSESRSATDASDVHDSSDSSDSPADGPAPVEDGSVHRRLIRAQLPRIEGQKEERRLPEFTIRQQPGRGAPGFRGEGRTKPHVGGAGGNGGNNQRGHGAHRFAAARPGAPGRSQHGRGGASAGFRGAAQPRPGGPRKRSR